MKLTLARIAARIEHGLETLLMRPRVARVISPYIGYATSDAMVLRGRVLAATNAEVTEEGQSKLRNFRQMARMFATQEVAGVTLTARDQSTVSDAEGYFTLTLPRQTDDAGWLEIPVAAGDVRAQCPVRIPGDDAARLIISDIDDTMMLTGAWSLWRNLWTSLTGNALTRQVFDDAVAMMDRLSEGGRHPVFFVSSSPWNFHGFLQQIFDRAGLPRAPMFLRDYGIAEDQFITGTHGDHKGQAIDTILAAHPDLPAILIGDTGQHDAVVYADAAARHPGRIAQVILRRAGDADVAAEVARLQDAGVTVDVCARYDGIMPA